MRRPLLVIIPLFVAATGFVLFEAASLARIGSLTQEAAAVQAVVPAETAPERTEAPELPLPEPQAVEAPTVTQTASRAVQDAPEAQPTVDPWTAELTAAHVPAAEQDAARALLFEGAEWKTFGSSMLPATKPISDTQRRITKIHFYVMQQYGTWNEAKAHADANGGVW